MISVIVYGRNDDHGYNLHRRAALSLNCIAQVLTDPNDEIIFVDYNTPDELPTFVEAISDTLTDRCLGRLRVLRVPAAVHRQRFAARTHLPAIEPVARGLRHVNLVHGSKYYGHMQGPLTLPLTEETPRTHGPGHDPVADRRRLAGDVR